MKIKSKIIFMIICVTLILLTFMQTVAYATLVTDNSKKMYIGIEELRRNDEPNLGYSVGDPNTNGATGESNKIWSLVEFTGPSDTDNLKANGNKNIYCLKAGVGFSNTNKRATYDVFFNMKTERTQIEAQNDILEELVGGTVPYKASSTASVVQISRYNALLALGDMLYLMEDSEQEKEKYLNAAGIYSEYWDSTLTRDEISAVQQMAIWYFTNYEAGKTTFDKTGDDTTGWLWYTEDGKTYRNFAQYNPSNVDINSSHGAQRQQQAEMLYRYLIQTAKSKASEYDASKLNQEAPVSLDTAYLDYGEVGTNYIMGPIHMSANANNPVNYEMDFVVKNNGTATTGYQLLNSSKQPVAAGTTVKSLVGQDFYISMPVATTGYVEVEANVRYTNRNQTLWTADGIDGDSTQPVLIPSKKAENLSLTLDVMPSAKEFDLSLRKYITKVGDEVLSGAKSRVPVIDVSQLLPVEEMSIKPRTTEAITTAIYQHRKDPIVVRTNEKIIYNITIYNEGEKAGRATKIVDQLPQGLRYDRVVSGNFVLDSYNETTNTLNLKRAAGNNTNLAPFVDRDELDTETIQIECTVTAYAAANKQVLTNLAWISEEIDGESGVTITTQRRLDRDSEPATITKYNKAELVTADNGYTGNTSNEGQDLASPDSYFEGQQDDDDFEKVVINPATGSYNIQLIKVAENDLTKKLQGAQFEITLANGTKNTYTTDANGSLNINDINITAAGVENITIKETVAPKGYSKIIDTIILKVKKEIANGEYKGTVEALTKEDGTAVPTGTTHTVDGNTIKVTVPNREKTFDLALRKYITKAGEKELNGADTRAPSIDRTTLDNGTTATYKHRKDPVPVKTGEKVIYNLAIYNEGEKSGRATKVVDQLPTGLQFNRVITSNFVVDSYNETTNTLNLKRADGNNTNLGPYTGNANPASEVIQIECTVTAKASRTDAQILTNLAWISEEFDEDANRTITNVPGQDRDSEPSTITTKTKDELVTTDNGYIGNTSNNGKDLADRNNYFEGQQDDDDFEKIIIPAKDKADLKLVKRIVKVNDKEVPERIESVDVSKLNIAGTDSKTTADYQLNKKAVEVKKGDIVTYTLRVYNEGLIDAYAAEITEDVPEGLEYLCDETASENPTDEEKEAIAFNKAQLWGKEVKDASGKITQISTGYLSKDNEKTPGENLIKAFGQNDGTKTEEDLDYREVSVKFKVISENVSGTIIRNEAAVTEDTDEDGEPVDDRDSKPEEWKKYEDDEDYDNIILKEFDLALRKFIVAVSKDENIEDSEYLKNEDGSYKRAPVVDSSKLNTKDDEGNLITTAIYNHTKEPVLVQRNDIVVYMLRVYNEGDIDGYAAEIKDHLPPHLEFVDSEFNKQYGWEVSEDGRTVTTTYLKDSLVKKPEQVGESKTTGFVPTYDEDGNLVGGKSALWYEYSYKLDYKEVPIMCKVKDTAPRNENITNIADITKYEDEEHKPVEDRDSQEDNVDLPEDKDLPGYKDDEKGDYVPGQQDDDDFEKVIVKKFDLALRKWVTQAIVTDKNGTTVTNTGHQPYDDPEGIVKVELDKKNLSQVTVKFRYSIRVINEGDIEGYAKEVTDYIPEGLRFIAADNPGWTDEGNNVISTRLLENTLLKPGEYADVEVLLTWINNSNNMGLKVNTAEISEDYNDYDVPDEDSTPDNEKPGEDDIDDAPVMLSVKTGKAVTYIGLGLAVLVIMASGVTLIKKYVM